MKIKFNYSYLLLAAISLLTACATQNTFNRQGATKEGANAAIKQTIVECQKLVGTVDDGVSDASSVALALSTTCFKSYVESSKMFALANLDNDRQVRMFMEDAYTPKQKIEFFLPLVMKYRVELKNKEKN